MVNKVILVGYVGKDPETRKVNGSQSVASIRLATSRSWNERPSGERKEETEWHDVEVWGKMAEACGEYVRKGTRLYVEGRIKTDHWEDKERGQKRSRVKIVADAVRFLGKASGKAESQPADEPAGNGESGAA